MGRSIVMSVLDMKGFSREVIWIAAGQGTAVLGAIIGVKMLTEALPPQIYGELALGMTGAMLANQTLLGPLSNAYIRYFAVAREARETGRYIKSVMSLTVTAATLVLAVGTVTLAFLEITGYGNWLRLVAATVVFAILSACNSIMGGIQNAARQRSVVALHQGVGTWLRFFCAIHMVKRLGLSSAAAMCGYLLAELLISISQFFFWVVG